VVGACRACRRRALEEVLKENLGAILYDDDLIGIVEALTGLPAMHSYHDVSHAFPSAFTKPSNYGWGVWLLPFVEQTDLYNAINPLAAPPCTRYAWSSLHTGGGINTAFCDGAVHFLREAIATDPSQEGCNEPVPANVPLMNLYFSSDGNVVDPSLF
jgi:prepilin-type processing-associated H-X9-DG protein